MAVFARNNRIGSAIARKNVIGAVIIVLLAWWLIELIYPTGGQLRWLEVENTTSRTLTIEVDGVRYRQPLLPRSKVTLSEKVFRGHSFFCRFFDEDGKLFREVYLVGDELRKIDDHNKLNVKL